MENKPAAFFTFLVKIQNQTNYFLHFVMFLGIKLESVNPFFNIAAEEYLLKNFKDDVFLLYRNQPSIIIGKHQIAHAEINHEFIKKKDVKIVRRLSGGGTVYHDLGNLNFSFITTGTPGKLLDFKKFIVPIKLLLQKLDINVKLGDRNELLINDKKISGNAEHIFKNRVLHHGTLLFSANLENLAAALKVKPLKYNSKAIQSVRSKVSNIADCLKKKMNITEFADLLMEYILTKQKKTVLYELTQKDKTLIQKLVDTKYATWDWNFAYSPSYTLKKIVKLENKLLQLSFDVKKGRMSNITLESIHGDFQHAKKIEAILNNCKHKIEDIREKFKTTEANIPEYEKMIHQLF